MISFQNFLYSNSRGNFTICSSALTSKPNNIPEIRAKNIDAAIIHEAAIGRINDEQLLKLRTLGLTEEEAEAVIIQNFLN